jgi:dihydrofolate reductase
VKLAIIAAIARNRVIGSGGHLPWHIPEDLRRFKRLTSGHTVLMGHRTYESIGRPLPDRHTVVITSRLIPGVETYASISAALTALAGRDRVFVIGGGKIYAQLLDQAEELYLTIVDTRPDGDVFFPPYEHLLSARFTLARREDHDGFTFLDYIRR